MADAMNNRDRVINGLECCATNRMRREDCEAMDCAYLYLEEKGCIHQLIRDALALLKAQPRVMTLDEVAALEEGAVAWFEERYEKAGKSYMQPMMSNGQGMMIGTHLTVNPARMSMKGRRFWTARPTEEQRGAEAWQ